MRTARSIRAGALGLLLLLKGTAMACAPLETGVPVPSGTALVIVSREDDSFFPGVAFRAAIEVVPDDVATVSGVFVVTGGGSFAALEFDNVEQDEWFHVWNYRSLEEAKAALSGTWTITVAGSISSASSFTFDASALEESDFFSSPPITNPMDGAVGVPQGVVTSWLPPASGPFPVFVLDVWIDYGLPDAPRSYSGPTGFLDTDATSWAPDEPLDPGLARFTVEYAVAAPGELVGPMVVNSGAFAWNASRFAPPGYPPGAPLVGLSGRTRIGFTVGSCLTAADLNCDGVVDGGDLGVLLLNWGSPGCGGLLACEPDLDGDGDVDGADLGLLLLAWGP